MITRKLKSSKDDSSWSICFGTKLPRRELDEAIVLLPSCIAGCTRSQSRLYKIFFRPMFRFCLKFNKGNLNATQDIAQEAFVKVFQNLYTLNTPEALHVWVAKVFLSEIYDHFRKSKTLKQQPNVEVLQIDEGMLLIPWDSSFESEYDFDALISSCSKRERAIFRLVARGYNYDDIGKELNLPTGTVKSLVFREREKIKKTFHWVRA